MALIHGGFRDFPKGIYTDAERDALDNATPPDPASGGSTFVLLDIGAFRRYGLTLYQIPGDGSRGALRRQLAIAGQAFAIAGSLGHFPAGHRLRKWQPSYTGGHAICVVSKGDDKVWWGDPLAPMKDAGTEATIADVLTFAWFPSDARVISDLGLIGRKLRQRLSNAQATLDVVREAVQD